MIEGSKPEQSKVSAAQEAVPANPMVSPASTLEPQSVKDGDGDKESPPIARVISSLQELIQQDRNDDDRDNRDLDERVGLGDAEEAVTLVTQHVDKNDGLVIGVLTVEQRLRRAIADRDLPLSYIQACERTFVAPSGLLSPANDRPTAMGILREDHVLVLIAESNMGRHFAAVHLLKNADNVTVREVRREPNEHFEASNLREKKDSGWLLDFRKDDKLNPDFGAEMVGCRQLLKDRSSYLVVIMPSALWKQGSNGGESLAHYLNMPSSEKIIHRHLESAQPSIDLDTWFTGPDGEMIRERVQHLEPDDALLWSETIRTTRDAELPADLVSDEEQSDLPARIRMVLEARENWRDHLLRWHKDEKRDSRHRNFLLAASLLEYAPPGLVFTAATSLAVALGEKSPEDRGQQGPGILELVETVDADLVDDETFRFPRPGYPASILDYFWIDRQHLREKFIEWMCSLPSSLDTLIAQEAVERITAFVLKWTLRQQDISQLKTIAKVWGARKELREAAAQLITVAALDPQLGRNVRDLILTWAQGKDNATADMQILVAEICAGQLATFYPIRALYRLGYLVQSPDDHVANAATNAISVLWEREEIRTTLLVEVGKWCRSNNSAQHQAGADAFLALAALSTTADERPSLLIYSSGNEHLADAISSGWQAVLEDPDSAKVSSALASWFNAAVAHPELATPIQDLLVTSARGHAPELPDDRRRVSLTTYLYAWQPAFAPDTGQLRTAFREGVTSRLHASAPLLGTFADSSRGAQESVSDSPDVQTTS
ncbi:hypothetical protein [Nonomuraea endophytica]|uniref:hypothetical protein n=1 Tax=Nonomuraea endophytica TaxID=714136 RepID=UPI0037C8DD33